MERKEINRIARAIAETRLRDTQEADRLIKNIWEAIQQESPVTAAEFAGQCQQYVIAFFNGIKYTRSWL